MRAFLSILFALLIAHESFATITKMNGVAMTASTKANGAGRAKANGVSITSGTSYLIHEDCEGTGTPSGWTDFGTANWDYTTTSIGDAGTQSLTGILNSGSYKAVGAGITHLYIRFKFRTASTASTAYWLTVYDNGVANAIAWLKFNDTSGTATIVIGPTPASGDVATAMVTQVANNTTYYVWFEVIANGSSTSANLAINTTLSQPTSGNSYTSISNSTKSTLNPGAVAFGQQNVAITTPIWDDMIVSSSAIGNAAF